MTKRIHEVRSVKFSDDKRGIDYANYIQEDTNCDNLTYKGNCEEIVAEDFLILKEDNPVTESKMKSQEDTSVKPGGDTENDSTQTEPIEERCAKGGRKKGETKSILEERHKARLEEQERKLIEEGVRRSQRIKDRNDANLIMEIDHYIPENFKEAMDSGERNEWHKAMEEELSEIEKHKVWTLVPKGNGRRPVRGQITKLINSVETALKKPVEELDKTDLRVSALQLEDLCRDLHEWDEKVTEAMLDEEMTEEVQDKEYDERLRYDRLIKRMREELEKVEDIHNDEDLSDSDKYQYLVDCMLENSEAQQLVLSYPVSGKNYASVIKDLRERFGRDIYNMLIKVYVRDLLWLVIRNAQERKVNFKDLVTKLNSQIRHLSMLGVTTDKCAEILYPVVESCLPEDVLISWQRSSEPEDLESLMKFLRREVNQTKDREMAYNKYSDSLAQPTPGKIETKKRSFNARREIATTSGFMHSDISPTLREKFKCIFCDNGHPSQDCRKGMKMGMDQKNEKIKSYKRCFKCLLPGHRSRQCKKKVRCDFCMRDGHYAIMCRGVHHAETEIKSPQRPQNSTPTPVSSDVATVNEMSNCVSTKACLETLLVKVWGPKGSKVVRAVIDSGSSQSYILEHIVKDMGVPIMGEEELDHEIFGGIRYTDRHRIYCLTLSSIENDRCISCPASATNQIARCIRKPTFGSWARELASKKIQLSAFKAESDVVELLLGADINPKIATANMIRLSDDLIARETLLGWVVQGKTEGKFPDKNPNQVHNSMLITSLMTQEIKVSDLWSLENIGVMDDGQAESKKETDQAVMDKFRTETKRLESGRYELMTLTISDKLMMTPTHQSLDQENDAEIENQTHKLTKRIMLSEAHAVFDPLGLFSPFTIVPKIILQQCWKSELKWDQPVPEDIVKKFVEWQSQIPELLSVRIPRWVMRDGFEQASLHVFCDASQDAYATCIYLRTVKNEEVNVQLVASKARVAPKKKLTIPRLELMSCLIGSRLTKQVMKIISESIAISENNIWFWTDSSTALRWIQNEKPWATFVRNRVNEICSISKKENWHHVSGANNPADLPSHEEPIFDNEDKDPTYESDEEAFKFSHGDLLPSTYEEAINNPDSTLWTQAMNKEIHSLKDHHVWNLIELPQGAKPIKSKWVFSKKIDPLTNKEIFKARLVALGCSQTYGTDYNETFSPVMKTDSFRTLLAYATMMDYEFNHFDVVTAFLYGKLTETIYMTQPEGYQRQETLDLLKLAFGNENVNKPTTFRLFSRFKNGMESVKDEKRVGRPILHRNPEK
ncbi:hypothetical protein LAZ67_11002078, partial [Cordylochernes scorpioides]